MAVALGKGWDDNTPSGQIRRVTRSPGPGRSRAETKSLVQLHMSQLESPGQRPSSLPSVLPEVGWRGSPGWSKLEQAHPTVCTYQLPRLLNASVACRSTAGGVNWVVLHHSKCIKASMFATVRFRQVRKSGYLEKGEFLYTPPAPHFLSYGIRPGSGICIEYTFNT